MTDEEYEENQLPYEYRNTCVECGRQFMSGYIRITLCPKCLEILGLHIEEEHYA